jgi:hypothetical protein
MQFLEIGTICILSYVGPDTRPILATPNGGFPPLFC